MKRAISCLFFCFMIINLFAYELGSETYDRYTIFDPDARALGLTYPVSWLQPGAFLFQHDFEDSSYTYARWDQLFMVDQAIKGYNLSSDIVVKYIPYSFPQRWGVGLEFIDYKGSTKRNDVVIHYKHNKGSIEYFRTENTQSVTLGTGTTDHMITSNGLQFDYQASPEIRILGGINYNLIDQQDAISRNYDTFHEFAEIRFTLKKPFILYGKFEYRHFWNDGQQSNFMVFRPGARYQSPKMVAHLAFRISPKRIFPIAQIIYRPKPFFIEAYAKVRTPRIILKQQGHQYVGVKTGLKYKKKKHYLHAEIDTYYDFVRKVMPDSVIINDFYGIKAHGEYRFITSLMEFYGRASYNRTFNELLGYYHPELSTITGGAVFHAKLADGKLLLDGDINAQYIIHDNPENVRFDPSTLTYTLQEAGDYVGDWKINMRLKARVQTFSIALEVSTPLKANKDLYYYLYEGIYTSSDFEFGNTFYTGLYIEWCWWK
ncbi:MAG: hypothetical protein KAT14_01470 [Candidatus Marinimicrobia bacterium]|nr:hypothetical protein [Candidatus Neomarinimicrobiota bacterium]